MAKNHELEDNPELVKEESAGVIAIRGDEVLVVRHGPKAKVFEGHYGLPSGRREIKSNGELETFRETAARELFEETGLIVDPDSLIEFPHADYKGEFPLKTGPIYVSLFKLFIATSFTGELVGEPGKTTPEWVNIKRFNLLYPTTVPGILTSIQSAIEFMDNLDVAKP